MEARKDALKRSSMNKRQALSEDFRMSASQLAAEQFFQLDAFATAKNIAFYVASQAELDPEPILQEALKRGKHCVLPVITDYKKRTLAFYSVTPILLPNRYGILEPEHVDKRPIPLANIDLVVVPMVAFDRKRNRLGMGQGYYDRVLTQMPAACFVGIAYDCQCVDQVPTDPWDVMMDYIITPELMLP